MKTNILIIYEYANLTQKLFYEIINKFSQGRNCEIKSLCSRKIKKIDLFWSDVIVAVRSQSPLETAIMKRAKKMKRFCISYWDDDLIDPYEGFVMPPLRRKALLDLLTLVDVVYSSNKALSLKLASFGKGVRAVQTDTLVEITQITKPKIPYGNKVKLVYAAGKSHNKEFENIVAPALVRLHNTLGNIFSLTFIGTHPIIPQAPEDMEIQYINSMPLCEYRSHMRHEHYDIGLAPVQTSESSKHKYYNKFVEYSLSGIPGIYSNCLPYTLIIRDKNNGLLCENTEMGWYTALHEAITNPELRKNCILNAQVLLLLRFSREAVFTSIEERIPEFTTYKAPDVCMRGFWFEKMKYYLFKFIYLPVFYINAEGCKNMVTRVINNLESVRFSKQ